MSISETLYDQFERNTRIALSSLFPNGKKLADYTFIAYSGGLIKKNANRKQYIVFIKDVGLGDTLMFVLPEMHPFLSLFTSQSTCQSRLPIHDCLTVGPIVLVKTVSRYQRMALMNVIQYWMP